MTNIVTLNVPRRTTAADHKADLLRVTARGRMAEEDVFWLKENAELLNILSVTGAGGELPAAALACYDGFYEQISERLAFFPQYYRFLLSICLDIEDLRGTGETGQRLCEWVADQGLVETELSDLQRAEVHRLLARRGVASDPAGAAALEDRLGRFMGRSATFAMPNKKAAYELTHIVFYLAEYGARTVQLAPEAVTSLRFAGLMAYLDQDADLLAEVCVALRFAGQTPSKIWEDWVAMVHRDFDLVEVPGAAGGDAFHEYLVTAWATSLMGRPAFTQAMPQGTFHFSHPYQRISTLRSLSVSLFEMGPARSDDWDRMRAPLAAQMSEDAYGILALAEQSTDGFGEFFDGFARAIRV